MTFWTNGFHGVAAPLKVEWMVLFMCYQSRCTPGAACSSFDIHRNADDRDHPRRKNDGKGGERVKGGGVLKHGTPCMDLRMNELRKRKQ